MYSLPYWYFYCAPVRPTQWLALLQAVRLGFLEEAVTVCPSRLLVRVVTFLLYQFITGGLIASVRGLKLRPPPWIIRGRAYLLNGCQDISRNRGNKRNKGNRGT